MYLGKKKLSELTAREKYMRVKMEKQSIDYFPIGKSLLIPSEETVDIGELVRYIHRFTLSYRSNCYYFEYM